MSLGEPLQLGGCDHDSTYRSWARRPVWRVLTVCCPCADPLNPETPTAARPQHKMVTIQALECLAGMPSGFADASDARTGRRSLRISDNFQRQLGDHLAESPSKVPVLPPWGGGSHRHSMRSTPRIVTGGVFYTPPPNETWVSKKSPPHLVWVNRLCVRGLE